MAERPTVEELAHDFKRRVEYLRIDEFLGLLELVYRQVEDDPEGVTVEEALYPEPPYLQNMSIGHFRRLLTKILRELMTTGTE